MTIVVGVAAPDGLILAADSRTTVQLAGPRTRIQSDNAQKVFLLCERYGVACYGQAFLQEKTISGAIKEFEATIDPKLTLAEFIVALGSFFQERALESFKKRRRRAWKPSDDWELGLLVAGFDDANVGHLFEIRVPGADGTAQMFAPEVRTTNVGFAYRGMIDVAERLLAGFDVGALAETHAEPTGVMRDALAGLEYKTIEPITMQDAIDWAMLLIRTTIDVQRLTDGIRANDDGGIPGCGGPVRVLALDQDSYEWVSRPALTTSPPGNAEGSVVSC
ncbi:MAG: hypothetical protein ACLQBB_03830 [Solirubrobacteraceae bacterium]